jgi:hypothetical protein
MDILLTSLEYTKLSVLQVPTLFFLAEAVIYWIRTETIKQIYLRSYEVKLLKVNRIYLKLKTMKQLRILQ